MIKNYAEQRKHPLWQQKRLEIMERDGFACTNCGYDGKKCWGDGEEGEVRPLNVHHGYYEGERDYWDYPNESLYTLCESCHADVSENTKVIKILLSRLANNPHHQQQVIGYLLAMIGELEETAETPLALTIPSDYETMMGVADYFGIAAETLSAWRNESEDNTISIERLIQAKIDPAFLDKR